MISYESAINGLVKAVVESGYSVSEAKALCETIEGEQLTPLTGHEFVTLANNYFSDKLKQSNTNTLCLQTKLLMVRTVEEWEGLIINRAIPHLLEKRIPLL